MGWLLFQATGLPSGRTQPSGGAGPTGTPLVHTNAKKHNRRSRAVDLDSEEVAGELGIVAPHRFKQLVAMERAPAVAGERVEEFELPLREGQGATIDAGHTTARIHLKAPDLNRGAFGGVGIVERA